MRILIAVSVAAASLLAVGCEEAPNAERKPAAPTEEKTMTEPDRAESSEPIEKIARTDEAWRKELTDEEFHVLRERGTERAFTGKYHDYKGKGTFVCAGCGLPLFSSEAKFDSGTGWPSFYKPVDKAYVDERADNSLFVKRTEVVCARCGGHLGHVFPDGPKPTGLRYCINSVALDLEKPETE